MESNNSTAKISSFEKFSVRPIFPIFSIYESTRFFTYGTIFRICTFGNQQINRKNIQFWKFFSFSNFSNFVNLRLYAVYQLWYNIQDLYIWKSTTKQKKNPTLNIFQCLQFSNFVNLRLYAVFHLKYNIQDLYVFK